MSRLGEWVEEGVFNVSRLVVPFPSRAEWVRSWEAELCYARACGGQRLLMGMVRDALWMRAESWRLALAGTAALCVLALLLGAGLAACPLVALESRGFAAGHLLVALVPRFLVASVLTLLVSFATSFVAVADGGKRRWGRAFAFQAAKVLLLLVAAALVSTDLCLPLEVCGWFVAMPAELLLFVLLALVGLRWSFADSRMRCKRCLRCLSAARRVGPPSRNFLDYNGTELACGDGHGVLAVPELETSWCRSSAWVVPRG